jgi:hypothetical protein
MNLALDVLLGMIAWTLLSFVVAVMVGAMTTRPDVAPRSTHQVSKPAKSNDGPTAA